MRQRLHQGVRIGPAQHRSTGGVLAILQGFGKLDAMLPSVECPDPASAACGAVAVRA